MQELREEFMWLQTFEFFQMLPNFVNSVMAVLQPQTMLSGIMYHPAQSTSFSRLQFPKPADQQTFIPFLILNQSESVKKLNSNLF